MRVVLPLLLLPILAGCASGGPAPSLSVRPVERMPILAPEEAREAEGAADQALSGRIAPIVTAADAGHAEFKRERIEVARAVARAGKAAAGGDAWLAAQQALSALEARRAPVRDAAAAIEALRQEPANAAPGNRAAVDAAAARIEAIEAAQSAAVAELTGALR